MLSPYRTERRPTLTLPLAAAAAALLLSASSLAAQVRTAVVLSADASIDEVGLLDRPHPDIPLPETDDDVDEVGLLDRPHPDIPLPENLERMTVSEALRQYLKIGVAGDMPRDGVDVQIHAVHVRRGRVMKRYRGRTIPGDQWSDSGHFIPGDQWFPRDIYRAFGDRRVRGAVIASRPIAAGEALEDPGSLIVDGIFDASRKARLGDVLFFVAVPTDRKMMRRTEAVAMLVMF